MFRLFNASHGSAVQSFDRKINPKGRDSEHVLLEGTMRKRVSLAKGGGIFGWHMRYFILTDRRLLYFKERPTDMDRNRRWQSPRTGAKPMQLYNASCQKKISLCKCTGWHFLRAGDVSRGCIDLRHVEHAVILRPELKADTPTPAGTQTPHPILEIVGQGVHWQLEFSNDMKIVKWQAAVGSAKYACDTEAQPSSIVRGMSSTSDTVPMSPMPSN